MAAPLGNQFWKQRSSHGPNPKFSDPDVLWAACLEYFEWVDANPLYEAQAFAYQGSVKVENIAKLRAMTIAGLCVFLDISHDAWEDYRKREDLSVVTTRVDRIIRDQKFTGAAAGLLNANIIARDLGLVEKQEHTGKDGTPLVEPTSERDLAKAIALVLAKGLNAGT